MSFVKEALAALQAPPSHQQDEARRQRYLRNREQIRQKAKIWRMSNAAKLKRYKKRYARMVKAGVRVPQTRVRVGNSYVLVGVTRSGVQLPEDTSPGIYMERIPL